MSDDIRLNAASILAISLRFFIGMALAPENKTSMPLPLHNTLPTIN
jgi:hypothetical protein